MDTRYSQALERQLQALAELDTPRTRGALGMIMEGLKPAEQRPRLEELVGVVRCGLTHGETYYWDSALVPFLRETAATLPDMVLTRELLPSRAGFLWFGRTIPPPPPWDVLALVPFGIAAVSWDSTDAAFLGNAEHPEGSALFSFWVRSLRREDDVGFPCMNIPWGFGRAISNAQAYTPAEGEGGTNAQQFLPNIGAALAFMNQRIVVSSPHRADRATRRRLGLPSDHEALVRVIELRRREHVTRDEESHTDVEWSCQWLVRGHWRRLEEGRRVVWVHPYRKGPEDKPLRRPRADVFAVIR